ncbi:MAG: aspartate-semialdehyde dehydrogenase [Deltaproteobacteria bacterium]|nr:aspartate-semialdehyde dehydrogenase [Deltaproteobacteria bacterium]
MKAQHVAIVGATGAVGQEMLRVLADRRFAMASLRLIASPGSAGRTVRFAERDYVLMAPSREAFEGVDLALFSAGASVSRAWAPVAAACGAWVVDNSSAYRQDPEIPLVVPEVNAEALANNPRRIIANPNCSTIQMLVALAPMHRAWGLERVVVSTYQAISGKGARALDEFDAQVRADGRGESPAHEILPGILSGNLLCDWAHGDDGWSEEERKMVAETRKILSMPSLAVSPTTVRVPVRNGHSESVWARFARPVTRAMAHEVLGAAEGVVLTRESGPGVHPQPRTASGQDAVFVGRVREDGGDPNALMFFVVSDNVRKGAALNAVQIAERVCL